MRLFILALAFPVLMPAGSAFASLMTVSYSEPIEIVWDSTHSTPANDPAPESPNKQKPGIWNLICGLAGSMESSVRTVTSSSVASGLDHENLWPTLPEAIDSCLILKELPPPEPPVTELLKVPIGKFVI